MRRGSRLNRRRDQAIPSWGPARRANGQAHSAARRFRGIGRVHGEEPLTGVAVVVVLVWIWVLAILQAGLLARISLPLGATAPVLVTVLVLGHTLGAGPGALFGAWAGLMLDLIPPAAGPVGAWALILTVAGLTMGYVCEARRPGPWLSLLLVGLGAAVVVLMRAILLWFAGHAPALGPTVLVALCACGTSILLAPVGFLGARAVAEGRRPQLRGTQAKSLGPLVRVNSAGSWETADGVATPMLEQVWR